MRDVHLLVNGFSHIGVSQDLVVQHWSVAVGKLRDAAAGWLHRACVGRQVRQVQPCAWGSAQSCHCLRHIVVTLH